MSFDAYYYSFEPTGNAAIDSILEAVAAAGKGCHHTEDWREYGLDKNIQDAANEAAASLAREAIPPAPNAQREAGKVMMRAHALCPSKLTPDAQMRWIADYFLTNFPPAPAEQATPEQAEVIWPTNSELEELWEEHHYGHPADFAADVLERWGGCPAGLLGYGGTLERKGPLSAEPAPERRAPGEAERLIGLAHIICDEAGIPDGEITHRLVALSEKGDGLADSARLDWLEQRGNDGGLLLHAGNRDTGGRSGLGLANTGRTLRQAVDSARGIKAAVPADPQSAPTPPGSAYEPVGLRGSKQSFNAYDAGQTRDASKLKSAPAKKEKPE